jgi:phosphoglycerate dehydrogenase-like enzyme
MDRNRLTNMKTGAVLVNIARGAIVDTAALIQWLGENRGAAVLDVFEEEPLGEDSPLWELENVIVTPHNSFVGEGNTERLFQRILKNLQRKELR